MTDITSITMFGMIIVETICIILLVDYASKVDMKLSRTETELENVRRQSNCNCD